MKMQNQCQKRKPLKINRGNKNECPEMDTRLFGNGHFSSYNGLSSLSKWVVLPCYQ